MDVPILATDSVCRAALTVRLRALVPAMRARAADHDADVTFPREDFVALRDIGALAAPLAPTNGGVGLGTEPSAALDCLDALRAVGAGNLAVGRVFEGHVNALRLILRHGTPGQQARAADDAADGHLFAVWNTDDRTAPLTLADDDGALTLRGAKILCSAVGTATRPIVTARAGGAAGPQMVLPRLQPGERADASGWTPQGMRATDTGRIDLDGFSITRDDLIGATGDYLEQPDFSGGAWRASAVAFGGLESLLDAFRDHLVTAGRGEDPHQSARLAQAAIARETAHLWLRRAAVIAERGDGPADDVVAYVNMARLAVEAACLDAMRLVTRGVGLPGFMRPHPIERIGRDLATYLRQPVPDAALMQAASRVLAGADFSAL